MIAELSKLVNQIHNPILSESYVIQWGAPIPSFGDWTSAKIATVGINPSNREFVKGSGAELEGSERRFHTLKSLSLTDWSEASSTHLNSIVSTCKEYFKSNPYDSWFKKLDFLLSGTEYSYYFPSYLACHLDLVPYATSCKWGNLSIKEKTNLLSYTGDILGHIINESSILILVLNGKSVVDNFEKLADLKLDRQIISSWTLPRKTSTGVVGYGYQGHVKEIGGVRLNRSIPVIGYNHNIQSSFGVTNEVLIEIKKWIASKVDEIVR
ncbi:MULTISPECIES: hypothetical protein [Dyadobacter]|uniref:Uncharacterized protein n=2 Tax=Dyadobacter TaxID=120831 RepID=A0A5R9KGC6_9BACT|nr:MULTISPECIES: hypothetical protein [Dyadobacter]KAA6436801.1 hypothetical protein FEM33_20590 [Dyadobacter flavalbus]TLU95159.1 hypothetical protein FEM55_07390 [Dyadobacter sediminis]GGC16386.1 hypothetical protein GCM10011325_48930 [Dyadobacter sediminis]